MSKTPKNRQTITIIYGLYDQTDTIRYVGKTVKTLNDRLSEHIYIARKFPNKNHRTNWINSLLSKGIQPVIKELDRCIWIESQNLEQHYIKFYKDLGFNLVNATKGGEGNLGFIKSKATIDKLKSSLRKNSKPIFQYDFDGNFIQTFSSIGEAADKLEIKYLGIFRCIKNQRQSYYHFRFLSYYESDPIIVLEKTNFNKPKKVIHNKNAKSVIQMDLNNNILNRFSSAYKACQFLGISTCNASNIITVCKGIKLTLAGFKWKYEK